MHAATVSIHPLVIAGWWSIPPTFYLPFFCMRTHVSYLWVLIASTFTAGVVWLLQLLICFLLGALMVEEPYRYLVIVIFELSNWLVNWYGNTSIGWKICWINFLITVTYWDYQILVSFHHIRYEASSRSHIQTNQQTSTLIMKPHKWIQEYVSKVSHNYEYWVNCQFSSFWPLIWEIGV